MESFLCYCVYLPIDLLCKQQILELRADANGRKACSGTSATGATSTQREAMRQSAGSDARFELAMGGRPRVVRRQGLHDAKYLRTFRRTSETSDHRELKRIPDFDSRSASVSVKNEIAATCWRATSAMNRCSPAFMAMKTR